MNQTIELFESINNSKIQTWSRSPTITFSEGSAVSRDFLILGLQARNWTVINISLRVKTDLTKYQSMRFNYQSSDPNGVRYIRPLRLTIAGIAAYGLLGRLIVGSVTLQSIILQLTAVMSLNVIALVFPGLERLTSLTVVLFLSVYRTFCLSFLRTGGKGFEKKEVINVFPFVFVYGIIEWFAAILITGKQSCLVMTKVCHVVYGVVILVWIGRALRDFVDEQRMKIVGFGFFMGGGVFMTWISEVYGKRVGSTLSLLVYQTAHVLATLAFMVMETPTGGGGVGGSLEPTKLIESDGENRDLEVDSEDGEENEGLGTIEKEQIMH
jgi:hypothetical protein